MSQQNVLKRSHKTTEFSRERSFVKQSLKDANKRRSQTFNKPSMEIYRPPNIRSDNNNTPQLNVHAKEFTMLQQQQQQQHHYDLQTSKSSGHLSHIGHGGSHGYYDPNMSLQSQQSQQQQHNSFLSHSKSSGNILRHHHPLTAALHNHHPSLILPALPIGLVHSNSTSTILQQHHHHMAAAHQQHSPRIVNFGDSLLQYQQSPGPINLYSNGFLQQQAPAANNPTTTTTTQQLLLRRSKSFTADNNAVARSNSNSVQSALAKLKSLAVKEEELDLVEYFPAEDRESLKQAMEDPAQLPSRTLMDLVKVILERVVEGIKYSDAGAKICLAIIEREKNQTFIESLLNMCQQWYQERDKNLRGIKSGEGTRFTAFMWFLTEMCGQLKRRQLASNFESLQPDLVLLSVLAKSCQACVSLPIRCLPETECLFFVLTSIGRDLEKELPAQLEQLLANVRDGFLASVGSPAVRKTLLQLIELHASNWQLPGSSVLYYYPRIQ